MVDGGLGEDEQHLMQAGFYQKKVSIVNFLRIRKENIIAI
jgi:hypothetical protein